VKTDLDFVMMEMVAPVRRYLVEGNIDSAFVSSPGYSRRNPRSGFHMLDDSDA
jgi:hypothetical protein